MVGPTTRNWTTVWIPPKASKILADSQTKHVGEGKDLVGRCDPVTEFWEKGNMGRVNFDLEKFPNGTTSIKIYQKYMFPVYLDVYK